MKRAESAFCRVILIGAIMTILQPGAAGAVFTVATQDTDRIHFLDSGLNNLGSFPAGADNPNGLTASDSLIFSGHYLSQTVYAYDYNGLEQFHWSSPLLANCQALELVNGELATAYGGAGGFRIDMLNPSTGALIRSIQNPGGFSTEGLAFDGTLLWLLADALIAVNPDTGFQVRVLPNPAINTKVGGTGLCMAGPDQLLVTAADGQWWRVSTVNGAIVGQGSNGLNTYAAARLVPEPGLVGVVMVGALTLMRGRRAGSENGDASRLLTSLAALFARGAERSLGWWQLASPSGWTLLPSSEYNVPSHEATDGLQPARFVARALRHDRADRAAAGAAGDRDHAARAVR